VLYCVLKLCTVTSTLRWAVLTVLWIGFCHTGPISLRIDLFVFICMYFVCFCFILHSCCIIVSMVGWTWWDCLILRTYLPSVLWHCWLGHLTCKNSSPIWPIMCLVGRLTLLYLSIYLSHITVCLVILQWLSSGKEKWSKRLVAGMNRPSQILYSVFVALFVSFNWWTVSLAQHRKLLEIMLAARECRGLL